MLASLVLEEVDTWNLATSLLYNIGTLKISEKSCNTLKSFWNLLKKNELAEKEVYKNGSLGNMYAHIYVQCNEIGVN